MRHNYPNQARLPISEHAAFVAFCKRHGWVEETPNGVYEVTVMRRPMYAILYIHRRERSYDDSYTLHGVGVSMYKQFRRVREVLHTVKNACLPVVLKNQTFDGTLDFNVAVSLATSYIAHRTDAAEAMQAGDKRAAWRKLYKGRIYANRLRWMAETFLQDVPRAEL